MRSVVEEYGSQTTTAAYLLSSCLCHAFPKLASPILVLTRARDHLSHPGRQCHPPLPPESNSNLFQPCESF